MKTPENNIIKDIDTKIEQLLRQKAFMENHPELKLIEHSFISCDALHFMDAAKIGEVLGCDGWTRGRALFNSEKYDWRREIDGVTVIIGEAEEIPRPACGSPVSPKAFPLMLNAVNV